MKKLFTTAVVLITSVAYAQSPTGMDHRNDAATGAGTTTGTGNMSNIDSFGNQKALNNTTGGSAFQTTQTTGTQSGNLDTTTGGGLLNQQTTTTKTGTFDTDVRDVKVRDHGDRNHDQKRDNVDTRNNGFSARIIVDDNYVTRVRNVIREDKQLVVYIHDDLIDFVPCGNILIVFGVVDSEEAKEAIIQRVRSVQPEVQVQNKIIVK